MDLGEIGRGGPRPSAQHHLPPKVRRGKGGHLTSRAHSDASGAAGTSKSPNGNTADGIRSRAGRAARGRISTCSTSDGHSRISRARETASPETADNRWAAASSCHAARDWARADPTSAVTAAEEEEEEEEAAAAGTTTCRKLQGPVALRGVIHGDGEEGRGEAEPRGRSRLRQGAGGSWDNIGGGTWQMEKRVLVLEGELERKKISMKR